MKLYIVQLELVVKYQIVNRKERIGGIEYGRRMVRNTRKKYENKEGIRRISEIFHSEYVSDETSLL